jgi:hypothetical protein
MLDHYSQYPAPSIEEGASEIVFSLSARLGAENIDTHQVRAFALSFLRKLGHDRMGSYTGWYATVKVDATNHVQQWMIQWPRKKRILLIKMRFIGVLMSAYWKTLDKRFAPDARHFDTCKLKYNHLIVPGGENRLMRSRSFDSLLDGSKLKNTRDYKDMH